MDLFFSPSNALDLLWRKTSKELGEICQRDLGALPNGFDEAQAVEMLRAITGSATSSMRTRQEPTLDVVPYRAWFEAGEVGELLEGQGGSSALCG